MNSWQRHYGSNDDEEEQEYLIHYQQPTAEHGSTPLIARKTLKPITRCWLFLASFLIVAVCVTLITVSLKSKDSQSISVSVQQSYVNQLEL